MRYDHPSGTKDTRYAHTPKIVYDTFLATAKELNSSYVPQLVVFDPEVNICFGGMSYEQLASGAEGYGAIHKAIDEGLNQAALSASVPADSLLGKYENVSPSSDWHYVTIERGTNGTLRWKNRAGVAWTLEFRNGKELWAAKGSPFGQMKYEIKKDIAGKITGLKFGGSLYRLVSGQNTDQLTGTRWADEGGKTHLSFTRGRWAIVSGDVVLRKGGYTIAGSLLKLTSDDAGKFVVGKFEGMTLEINLTGSGGAESFEFKKVP